MTVQLVDAQISIGNVAVTRQGLKTIMFAARHNYFAERSRQYSSTTAMIADGIPTSSTIYKAAEGAFSQVPRPAFIKVGRFETKSIIKPVDAVEGKGYGLTLNAKGAAASLVVNVTAGVAETQEDIVTGIKAAIDAQADIAAKVTATVVGVGADAVLELTHAVQGDWFTVKALVNVAESFADTPENDAALEIAAIKLEDDDFYVFTSDVKETLYVQAIAATMASQFNFYAVSLDEQDALSSTLTGTFQVLQIDKQYANCYPIYHHEAKTTFPEVATMAEVFVYIDQGVTFANRQVAGVSPSKTLTGDNLSATQTANLMKHGINFFAKVKISGSASVQVTNPSITTGKNGGGLTSVGELALNIVGRDSMQIDMEANVTNLLLAQKDRRLAWDVDSLDKVYSSMFSVLTKYADTKGWNLIDSDFVIDIPDPKDIFPLDKAENILRQCEFAARLKDAIHLVTITGTLYRDQ
jgi:hypothetical protein